MGQKSSPVGLRLQINRTWDSRWFAEGQDYGKQLLEDLKIRQFIIKTLPQAAISKVVIGPPAKRCRIPNSAARPAPATGCPPGFLFPSTGGAVGKTPAR